jgi:hypothetical protein
MDKSTKAVAAAIAKSLSSESRPFELSTLLHEIADKWHKFS